MRSPLPANPRGPRRAVRRPVDLAVVVPTLNPEWELAALTALMKPPRKAALVANRKAEQPWSFKLETAARDTVTRASELLGVPAEVFAPDAGDFRFLARLATRDINLLRALAAALSCALPDTWFKLDRLWIHNTTWHRRAFGTRLYLSEAADVHLPRPLRTQLAPLLLPQK